VVWDLQPKVIAASRAVAPTSTDRARFNSTSCSRPGNGCDQGSNAACQLADRPSPKTHPRQLTAQETATKVPNVVTRSWARPRRRVPRSGPNSNDHYPKGPWIQGRVSARRWGLCRNCRVRSTKATPARFGVPSLWCWANLNLFWSRPHHPGCSGHRRFGGRGHTARDAAAIAAASQMTMSVENVAFF
jgi:hypothetical protein